MAYLKNLQENGFTIMCFNELVQKNLTKSTLGQVLEYVGGCNIQYRDKNENVLDIDNDSLGALRDEQVMVLLTWNSSKDTLSLIIFFEELEEDDVYNTIDGYWGELHNGAYDMLEMVKGILG